MESEKCYVYNIPQARPAERLRTDRDGLDASLPLRKQIYRKAWAAEEQLLETVARNANSEVIDRIDDFISASFNDKFNDRLPTALIVTGHATTNFGSLFEQICFRASNRTSLVSVLLSSSECPNLKTLLKRTISKITSFSEDNDDGDVISMSNKTPKLLNYDLQLVYDWCQAHDIRRVIVAFQDSEAFNANVLADALQLFKAWHDRLPIVLVFGVAVSIDIFQSRLPQSAVRCMRGESFIVANAEVLLEQAFEQILNGKQSVLHLGPTFSSAVLQHQKDHLQGITEFIAAIKYAFMSHFFANPLSVFLRDTIQMDQISKQHFEAIRNLPSFQKYVGSLLHNNEIDSARELLESNNIVFKAVLEMRTTVQAMLTWLVGALRVWRIIQGLVSGKEAIPLSTLYTSALAGELRSEARFRELLLYVKKIGSDKLLDMLNGVLDILMAMPPSELDVSPDDFGDIRDELLRLIAAGDSTQGPLRSIHEIGKDTLRTTVIAQKVGISKQKSKLSEEESHYSALVERFHDLLSAYLEAAIVPLDAYPLHEIFFYDLRSPYRDVFIPRPRFAIERALSAPHDYLGCDCCKSEQKSLQATQPPTAILYQLYLESGALINLHDLWLAFTVIIGDQYENEEITMALFYRALAELKYMGFIKSSRRKIDHLIKLAWKGL